MDSYAKNAVNVAAILALMALGSGVTMASSNKIALMPGGPHPYFAPWEQAAADAKKDFGIADVEYKVPAEWKLDLSRWYAVGTRLFDFNPGAGNGERFPHRLTHQPIDLPAIAIYREARRGADRQRAYPIRIVAFVRPAHQPWQRAQCVDDFRRAGDHGYDSRRHGAASKSANTNPSASRSSPPTTGMGRRNIGPA